MSQQNFYSSKMLNELPNEILTMITDKLDLKDQTNLSAVDQSFKTWFSEGHWQNTFSIHFHHLTDHFIDKSDLTWKQKFNNVAFKEYQRKLGEAKIDYRKRIDLLIAVKEGDLVTLKTYKTKNQLLENDLFLSDDNDINLLQWAKKNNQQKILDYLFTEIIQQKYDNNEFTNSYELLKFLIMHNQQNSKNYYDSFIYSFSTSSEKQKCQLITYAIKYKNMFALDLIEKTYFSKEWSQLISQKTLVKITKIINGKVTIENKLQTFAFQLAVTAIKTHDIEILKYLFEKVKDIKNIEDIIINDSKIIGGNTLLKIAISNNNNEIIKFLLDKYLFDRRLSDKSSISFSKKRTAEILASKNEKLILVYTQRLFNHLFIEFLPKGEHGINSARETVLKRVMLDLLANKRYSHYFLKLSLEDYTTFCKFMENLMMSNMLYLFFDTEELQNPIRFKNELEETIKRDLISRYDTDEFRANTAFDHSLKNFISELKEICNQYERYLCKLDPTANKEEVNNKRFYLKQLKYLLNNDKIQNQKILKSFIEKLEVYYTAFAQTDDIEDKNFLAKLRKLLEKYNLTKKLSSFSIFQTKGEKLNQKIQQVYSAANHLAATR